ncbi:MAG: GTPase Era, partial [Candidatus Phytoplasma stylosanthis]|nr:GTPase Era [Candidatus Phytoplasma stylosanthis]
MFKSGFITIIGKTNVGKSTLLNSLLEQKISIVSDKFNTTKQKIIGIYNNIDCQLVFYDNPGFIYKEHNILFSKINSLIFKNINEVDIILFLVDNECSPRDKKILTFLKKYNKKIILVITKIDLFKKKILIDKIILSYLEYFKFEAIIPLSSVKKQNLDILKDNIINLLNKSELYFPLNMKSNVSDKEFILELLREKIFFYLEKEIPHVCHLFLEKMDLDEYNSLATISILIVVPKINQKKILIG